MKALYSVNYQHFGAYHQYHLIDILLLFLTHQLILISNAINMSYREFTTIVAKKTYFYRNLSNPDLENGTSQKIADGVPRRRFPWTDETK